MNKFVGVRFHFLKANKEARKSGNQEGRQERRLSTVLISSWLPDLLVSLLVFEGIYLFDFVLLIFDNPVFDFPLFNRLQYRHDFCGETMMEVLSSYGYFFESQ